MINKSLNYVVLFIVQKKNTKRIMLPSKCAVCGSKETRFTKGQEANGLLSSLRTRKPLSQIL